jgi:hypothetical protein
MSKEPIDINKEFEKITKQLNMNIEVFDLSNDDGLVSDLYDQFTYEMLNSVVMIPFTFIADLPTNVFEEVINILRELHNEHGTDDF